MFDKCLLLKNGKIYATGNSEELFTDEAMSMFLNYPVKVVQADDHFYVDIDVKSNIKDII